MAQRGAGSGEAPPSWSAFLTGASNPGSALSVLQATEQWAAGVQPSSHPLVIAAGHGRTGTTSLQAAMELLGMTADHYSPRTMELVHQAEHSSCDKVDWRQFEQIDAVIDAPVPSFYLELLERFPQSKVILTVREPRSWLKSFRSHYQKFSQQEAASVLPTTPLKLNPVSNTFYADEMTISPNRLLDFGSNTPSDTQALKRYVAHNLEVVREVPHDRLLVMDIIAGDGWDKLCPFLGKPVPEAAFPHRNATGR